MGSIHVLPDDDIEELLRTAIVGRIACGGDAVDGGRPFLVPLAYGYDGAAVYAHSGPGRKLRTMRRQPLVTFEVDEATAADQWRSVIAEGRFEELTDPAARAAALRVIYPLAASIPPLGEDVAVYRIVLTSKSGRYEVPD